MVLSRERIPLSEICLSEDVQPRVSGLDERYIDELVTHSDPEEWPPIKVTYVGPGPRDFLLIDGYHRYEAARRRGLGRILAEVLPQGAGYRDAFEANSGHGRPMSIEDKKHYVCRLSRDEPQLSLRELGRRSRLSHNTVKVALRSGEGGQNDQPARGRVGNDPAWNAVRRMDLLVEDEGYSEAVIRREVQEYIETFEDEEDRRVTAENLVTWAGAISAASEPYLSL